ncbi:MAG: hypothetical protein HF978_21255 [Desulfobacteraceae bacterium]|nr:pyridoxamine 5'-phosphate oxidase family protein [Desulfobacteraceae bacterium]MBC2758077.1 hypothetical protein [Desulfobacteraceae bacterium]
MAPEINNRLITHRVKNLIKNSQAMTLATASNNKAWAAPVYYVNKRACFYFFSNPNSRHIEEAFASGQAGCTIYAQDASWQNLLGLQMSGKILIVPGGIEASKAILAYVKKFPIVKTFFPNIKNADLSDFICKFHAKLYCFIPEFIFFMDNSVNFGFRKEIKKESLFE